MGEVYEVKQRLTFWQKAFLWMVVAPICLVLAVLTVGFIVNWISQSF